MSIIKDLKYEIEELTEAVTESIVNLTSRISKLEKLQSPEVEQPSSPLPPQTHEFPETITQKSKRSDLFPDYHLFINFVNHDLLIFGYFDTERNFCLIGELNGHKKYLSIADNYDTYVNWSEWSNKGFNFCDFVIKCHDINFKISEHRLIFGLDQELYNFKKRSVTNRGTTSPLKNILNFDIWGTPLSFPID